MDENRMTQPSHREARHAASLRSTFGKQCLAQMPSAPACGFGSANRDGTSKMYVSLEADKAQSKSTGGNQSQGAIYKAPNAMGEQALSTKPSAPRTRFGSSKRSDLASGNAAPGPGTYKLKSTLGGSPLSRCATAPRARFGNALRDAQEKQFTSPEHEKGSVGRDSPGPGAYNVREQDKTQLSTHERAPGWKLSTGRRFSGADTRHVESIPGPGQYTLPSGVGKQWVSNKLTTPAAAFGKDGIRLRPKTAPAQGLGNNLIFSSSAPAGKRSQRPKDYSLSTVHQTPAWRFGTGRRLVSSYADSPGPGEYYA